MKGAREVTSKIARRVRMALKLVSAAGIILGFLLIIGTAGACDCGQIDTPQIVTQFAVGLAMFAGSALLARVLF